MRRKVIAGFTLITLATSAAVALMVVSPATAGATTYAVPPGGTITVDGHGNGHGHGMTQYGAKGAATAGLTAAQIVAFYYPHTSLVTLAASTIRVLISDDGGTTTVGAKAGLSLTGVGTLNSSGVAKWQLVMSPDVPGALYLREITTAGALVNVADGLPAQSDFSSGDGFVRLYHSDGSSTDYRGTVGAVRSGSTQLTINRVALDDYTMGVAPRESPASWPAAAEQAQAIAARTYGRNAVESHTSSLYDICDTDSCQVYGGKARYDASGNLLYSEYPAAITGNQNEVLQYNGATIFSQFSASDGGWTVDGGQPYLIAQADPYDNAATGDPNFSWTRTVASSTIAAYYSLASVNAIEVTARDGNGDWGGRVTAGFVDGTDSSGRAQRISVTGFSLQAAMGLPHNWFNIRQGTQVGSIDSVTVGASITVTGWAFDSASNTTSTRVDVYVGAAGYTTTANLPRPDVAAAYGLPSAAHGFSLTIPLPAGTASMCIYAIGANTSQNTLLACQPVTGPAAPIGSLDQVGRAGGGSVTIAGWTLDFINTSASTNVEATDAAVVVAPANLPRSDVQATYAAGSAAHGYSLAVPVPPGVSTVCAYADGLTPSVRTSLGCAQVVSPIGSLDVVTAGTALTVAGWGFDPSASGSSSRVDVYVGARGYPIGASGSRPDVAAAFGLSSAAHGFSTNLPLPAGSAPVCAYAISADGLSNTPLGCRTVSGPTLPIGSIDSVSAPAGGFVTVTGWALDFNNTATSTRVDLYGSAGSASTVANGPRADVQAVYATTSMNHGFTAKVPVPTGASNVCVYAIGIDTTQHSLLGCPAV